jgi:hypothetical protein
MRTLQIKAVSGGDAVIKEQDFDEFRSRFRGKLIQPGDDGYDKVRKVYNSMIDRRPGLIARCGRCHRCGSFRP